MGGICLFAHEGSLMKVFVTGAGGFIGGAIHRHLSGLGHEVLGHVSARDGKLRPDSVPAGMDLIVNSAGKLGNPSLNDGELTAANTLLPEMLATVCEAAEIHLVHISTPGVVGLSANSREESPLAPWGAYERSKAAGESLLRKRLGLPGGLLTILRPDFVYGPGDRHKLDLFRQVSRGIMPLIGWNGAVIRPTFVDDVCMAVSDALPGGCLHGDLFHVGGPETVNMRELTCIIAECLNRRVIPLPFPRWVYRAALRTGPLCPAAISESRRRMFGEDHFVCTEKASKAGFESSWGLRAGVSAAVSWYRSEGLLP
jgi:nucleoside-diphosphate-sugar epimerase